MWDEVNLSRCLDDTPIFRRQLQAIEGEVFGLESQLKNFAKATRLCVDGGKQSASRSIDMADELQKLGKEAYMEDPSDQFIGIALTEFSQGLREIDRSRRDFEEQMSTTMLQPMEEFLKNHITTIRESRKAFDQASSDLDVTLDKFMARRPADAATLPDSAKDVESSRMKFHKTSLDLAENLNEARSRRKWEVMEGVVAWLYMYYAWMYQSYETLKRMEPTMRGLSVGIDDERKKFNKRRESVRELKERTLVNGKHLYNPLNKGMFDVASGDGIDALEAEKSGIPTLESPIAGSKSEEMPSTDADNGQTPEPLAVSTTAPPKSENQLIQSELHSPLSDQPVYKAGYLYKRSQAQRVMSSYSWSRRFFVIQGELLHYSHRDKKDQSPVVAVNLSMSTVKVTDPATAERRNVFEVISAQKTYHLQAENEDELKSWVSAIQDAIGKALQSDKLHLVRGMSDSDKKGMGGGHLQNKDKDLENKERAAMLEKLRAIDGNGTCADCGTADPEWISINLGVLLCIECSGIHRSLGVHVSKVRSLLLDRLENELVNMITLLGNKSVNTNICFKGEMVDSGAIRSKRDNFIREKYVDHLYMRPVPRDWIDLSHESLHDVFWRKSKDGKLADAMLLIFHGANIDHRHADHHSMTALHMAVLMGQMDVLEFLLYWNADVNVADDLKKTATHYAAEVDQPRMLIKLLQRGARIDTEDEDRKTPMDIALAKSNANSLTIFRLYTFNNEESRASFKYPHVQGYNEALESFRKRRSSKSKGQQGPTRSASGSYRSGTLPTSAQVSASTKGDAAAFASDGLLKDLFDPSASMDDGFLEKLKSDVEAWQQESQAPK